MNFDAKLEFITKTFIHFSSQTLNE